MRQLEHDILARPAAPAGGDDAVTIERSWREPDDLAAETFLVAFDRRLRYDLAYRSARPWLYGIASNLAARHRRAELRRYRALARTAVAEAVDGHGERANGRVDAVALRGRLAAALLDVEDRDREVLLLVAWAQLSCEEAARALGIPAGTARSRLHQARRRTRAALADVHPGEDT